MMTRLHTARSMRACGAVAPSACGVRCAVEGVCAASQTVFHVGAEYFATELEAYAIATAHWQEAQRQQDTDFINIDLVAYNTSLTLFKQQLAEYEVDANLWDNVWANYTSYESLYYRLTCP